MRRSSTRGLEQLGGQGERALKRIEATARSAGHEAPAAFRAMEVAAERAQGKFEEFAHHAGTIGKMLVAEASSGDPIAVEYGFSTAEGYVLKFELFRVFLPQPKRSITSPGGVSAQYDWRAAYDEAEGTMLRVTLLNDVAGYA